ncbi:MAG: lactate racemase domain-containing protein [Sphaerochaeta sp.]|nr:lactate racemase domain-containing protein [Sphaerochaeta sp.]
MSDVYGALLADVTIPKVVRIRQAFERPVIKDVNAELEKQLYNSKVLESLKPGMNVAIAVGSRGIANLSQIVAKTVHILKDIKTKPFIVPAMGSHGGATGEGQVAVLAGFGITESTMGASIRSSMDVVTLATTESGLPVYFDAHAAQADATIIIAKIKPHPGFHGKYESGLAKMGVIGLGKQVGAELCHSAGMDLMADRIEEIGTTLFAHSNIRFAIGLLENAYDETARIVTIPSNEIMEKEPGLLEQARSMMPAIPFKSIDVLVVDEMGKDISGPGMDCNVIRRYTAEHIKADPLTQRIVIRDLTAASAGNATGMGNGDVITRRFFDKIKLEKTYPNQLTSRVVVSGKIPIIMENDDLAIRAAIKTIIGRPFSEVRMVRIKNTLHVEELEVSENLISEVSSNPTIQIISESYALPFDESGNIIE